VVSEADEVSRRGSEVWWAQKYVTRTTCGDPGIPGAVDSTEAEFRGAGKIPRAGVNGGGDCGADGGGEDDGVAENAGG